MSVHVVILAAGQGSRMKSNLPKVLHPLAGKSLLHHVVENADKLGAEGTHIVIGHGAELVQQSFEGITTSNTIHWSKQEQQLGTGHAVAQALPNVPDDVNVLVLYGDVPLTNTETLSALLSHVSEKSIALLTVNLDDPSGYGRIVRDASGFVQAIVEQKDASPQQLAISEINTGILAAPASKLKEWLPKLSNSNAQGEYYLTDIIAMAVGDQMEVAVANPACEEEVQGINNRVQLATLERWYQAREAERLMTEGATVIDPARLDVRGNVTIGKDVFIDVNVVFEGNVELAEGVVIGPNCIIKNAKIGTNTTIHANSIVEDSVVGESANVGPYARLRPGTQLANKTKVGNFVETKKAIVGEGSKINHLSYVGDAVLGSNVNVGAGTITCNYDGVNKFTTEIGDDVFVGSNSSLVAPVKIGKKATIGAGSTVTKEVDAEQLAVARGKQRNMDNWQRPVKK
ncbi:bifunctional UDP-N-acetylglucosamine diphosphorylase/glucosamine-1-phosphate N-acetyltransferase GlmU [Alkalimarinus sediminis]|uniref:Bifunctional protein GlmU n=1 Tax=Alkalimarinus sediminis TaxID=1632866 RepID=A0A9E8KJF9_9ALTE|nr:bifunctional UDP-N-acetylglucosamine diphosphorylase/glucosamine-1-phosphate N-acetyltransferase GlmU [Alkalimarinus sediminis]UZW75006.1 bifunctional UDP-N-acetylglucosamine diphosphorylase/glucosamine-1-phosphate N-acetyltransferase GlmU [Alkalimarinus sediminis]